MYEFWGAGWEVLVYFDEGAFDLWVDAALGAEGKFELLAEVGAAFDDVEGFGVRVVAAGLTTCVAGAGGGVVEDGEDAEEAGVHASETLGGLCATFDIRQSSLKTGSLRLEAGVSLGIIPFEGFVFFFMTVSRSSLISEISFFVCWPLQMRVMVAMSLGLAIGTTI